MDSDAALFALRAMGYSAVTDSEPLPKDDSYKGGDVVVLETARAEAAGVPQDAAALAAAAAGQAQSPMASLPPSTSRRASCPSFRRSRTCPPRSRWTACR